MERESNLLIDSAQGRRNPLLLAILSVIVGAISGLVGAAFRLALQRADELRNPLAQWAHGYGAAGFFVVLSGTALAPGPAAWMVARFSPESSGSGIPHVETQLKKRWSGDPARIAPVKFFGGRYLGYRQRLGLGPGRAHSAYRRQPGSSARENLPLQRA